MYKIRVATWNIGGGFIDSSDMQRFDTPDIKYFANELKRFGCKLIFIQEAHTSKLTGKSEQAEFLSKHLRLDYYTCVSISPSHLQPDQNLSLLILSAFPIENSTYIQIENPKLEVIRPDLTKWYSFDKGFLVVTVKMRKRVRVICGHSHPFIDFKRVPTDPDFNQLRKQIENVILGDRMEKSTCIVGADMNWNEIRELLPDVFSNSFKCVFENVKTTPNQGQLDYLLVSPDIKTGKYAITPGLSDHYLCVADLSLP